MRFSWRPFLSGILALTLFSSLGWAEESAAKRLFDPTASDAAAQLSSNDTLGDSTVTIQDGGIDVSVIANGKSGFPGVRIKPPQPWDASGYGHVEATVTNHGSKPIRVNLRIDNPGPWQENRHNTAMTGIKPGETKTVSTVFGYSYGKHGYRFDPAAVASVTIFVGKSDVAQSFRITQIRAAGPAGETLQVDPATVAVKPVNGILLGRGVSFDSSKQLVTTNGASVEQPADGAGLIVSFTKPQQTLQIRPATGMWNLSEHLQVRLRLKNVGASPVTPRAQLASRGGPTDVIACGKPIGPGEEAELVIPFVAAKPWQGVDLPEMRDGDSPKRDFHEHTPATGTKYTSNNTQHILLLPDAQASATKLQVTSIVADMPAQPPLPDWLGKRPPVDGDWAMTFEDNFDGSTIDLTKWNIYTVGQWHLGKATAYSKENVIVKDGKLHLRVEKRKAHHNDNPSYPLHEYATGWADSFGKWTQRYGYFEARLKLPTSPDSFTAFWLLPDRGIDFDAGKHPKVHGFAVKRTDTKASGMEFDIMEHLSIWGPNRHNFGCHWDEYGKYHKSTGSMRNYYQPDAEGFVTVGMLWTPGLVVMYQQGREAARWQSERISNITSYLILQHITGGWETEGMDDSQLPSDLIFDYVRVWQRKDLASAVDGPKPNDGGPLPPEKK